jgi:hypothetical protein
MTGIGGDAKTLSAMARAAKILEAILSGESDANIRFNDLCSTLERLGFARRARGSHHIFLHPTVPELINLQAELGKAKRYQVRQVRRILRRYGFTVLPGVHGAD